jgi:hypothetical protein
MMETNLRQCCWNTAQGRLAQLLEGQWGHDDFAFSALSHDTINQVP